MQLLLALAALHDWELHSLNIKTMFLNGKLDEEIYMEHITVNPTLTLCNHNLDDKSGKCDSKEVKERTASQDVTQRGEE